MVNTVTQTTLGGSGSDAYITRHIHITSDGSEETDLVIYDNSAFIADVARGRLVHLTASGSSCDLIFEWDQTTDAEVIRVNPADGKDICFLKVGGGSNPGAAGATGDLVLTTGNLDANDIVDIFIKIKQ